jgi:hypothetical protein
MTDTFISILDILSLEDLPIILARVEAARGRMPEDELTIIEREIRAQCQNEVRRTSQHRYRAMAYEGEAAASFV